MNMNRPAAMSTTGVSADVSSRGYGEQIAGHYRVREALSRELELKLEEVGERRVRRLIRWVNDDDESGGSGGSSSMLPLASTRSATSSSASSDYESAPWRLMQEKENYRVYEQQNEREKLLVMKGVLLLQSSSCGEVMELLSGSSSLDVQDFLTDTFVAQYGDSAVLHYVDMQQQQQHPRQPSSSLSSAMSTTMLFQWLALKDTHPLQPLRDFLFMRFNQTFAADEPVASSSSSSSSSAAAASASAMRNKVAYGASVWESIEIPSCRPLFGAATMQRHRFKHCGFVVEGSDETTATRVSFFITAPLDAATLQTERTWLLRMAASVRLLPSALVGQRIRRNQLVDKAKWDARDKCALCTASFTLMKRAHHCRICGTSVCSKCCTVRRDTRARNASGVRVCLSCLNGEDTSALWGASMPKRHLGNSSSVSLSSSSSFSSSSSRLLQSHAHRNRDSNASKDSRTSYQSSVESFSSSTQSFEDLSADADASAALASLRIRPVVAAIVEDRDEDDVLANTSFAYPLTFTKGMPWPDAPLPRTEDERLRRIRTLNLSQQYAKSALKELLDLARTSISCPVATVAVITASTCLLVTSVGLAGDQLPRDVALEAHVIMSRDPFVILDTHRDERFVRNPLVAQLNIRFYIGLPLVTRDGVVLGSLSLGDVSPRDKVKGSDLRSLRRLAARVVDKMDAGGADSAAPIEGMLLI
ncbi:hypothetical protein PybrP1_012320 [[Pythium] brassicae (nom. inval.)]|nr:hypothetical protein PybrP1_012320 [[Pythium] brassicae (nom. inval.)]